MKICMIVDDYLPESVKVAGKMMHELACEYQKQGHEITVVTPVPKLKKSFEINKLDGITICRFSSGQIKIKNKFKRVFNETLLAHRAYKALKPYFQQHKHDYIIYYSPSIFWGFLVAKLKKLWDAPSYLILRDSFPQWAIDQKLIKKGSPVEKYFRYFEKLNYTTADTIGIMSQKNLDQFNQTYPFCAAYTEVLHNWASDTPVKPDGHHRKKLGIEKKTIYFYGGNIGYAQDMMNLVRLAKNMQDEAKAYFVLVGAGDEAELVGETIKREKLENIILLPSVGQDEFKQMLAEFDVGLFALHKDHSTHNFPGKLLGYMVQELPILGSINGGNDLKEIVEKAGAGLITVNGEDEKLLENAQKFLDVEYRKVVGSNAKKLLQSTFSVEVAAKQILEGVEN